MDDVPRKRSNDRGKVPTLAEIADVEKQINLAQNEWVKSLRQIPLTDETCFQLIDYQLDCETLKKEIGGPGCNAPLSLVHVCVNKPPCNKNEKKTVTNKKEWCKGRGLKYGTEQFDIQMKQAYEIYKQVEKERQSRLAKAPKKLQKDLANEARSLEKLRKKIRKMGKIPNEDRELEERLEKLGEREFVQELEQKMSESSSPKKSRGVLRRVSRNLQNAKIKRQLATEVLVVAKKSFDTISDDAVRESRRYQETDTRVERTQSENISRELLTIFERVERKQDIFVENLISLQNQVSNIDRKQDRVLDLAQTINDRQLQEYVKEWYKSKWGVMKKISEQPLKALNIIVWIPAKNGFWQFFGRHFYLMWSLLMLILVVVCVVTCFTAINYYAPGVISFLNTVCILLWGMALRTGSTVAQILKPWFGESTTIVLNGIQLATQSILQLLWDFVLGLFISIFKAVAGSVGNIWSHMFTETTGASALLSYMNPMNYIK